MQTFRTCTHTLFYCCRLSTSNAVSVYARPRQPSYLNMASSKTLALALVGAATFTCAAAAYTSSIYNGTTCSGPALDTSSGPCTYMPCRCVRVATE
ncbi:hypothetical protein EON67_10800, partial [archaeon]